MALPAVRLYLLLFLFVVAPIGAVVVISALLLFGVTPHLVFAPGFGIKSLLDAGGLHVPNRIAVAGTGLCWWAVIASIGLIWEWRRDNRQPSTDNQPTASRPPRRE